MTYKINPIVERIDAPVTIVFPDSTVVNYSSGKEVAHTVFDKLYQISMITADNNIVVIELIEAKIEAVEDPFI